MYNSGRTLGSLIEGVLGVIVYQGAQKLDLAANRETEESTDKKKKNRDPNYPGSESDLEKNPDWKETSHPDQRKAGHREFTNGKTGESIRFDRGDPSATGHEADDHHHRYNPSSRNNRDRYLDANGNSTGKGSDASHLYPPL